MTSLGTPTDLDCIHCGDPADGSIRNDAGVFCCHGCQTVYELIHELDLGGFYDMEEKAGNKPGGSEQKYAYLDLPEVQQQLLSFKEGENCLVSLRLPSIHCSSRVWLLENLALVNQGVVNCEVNFVAKSANILYNEEKISLRELAVLLSRLGYAPVFDSGEKAVENTRRSDLIKLGVAGFCFGNIMLLSFPEYLISDPAQLGEFRALFAWFIFALSLPVILYSAQSYLRSAFKAVRAKTINLDVPISLGIMALYSKSVVDIFMGMGPGYMDSFAGFVFFLLIGRWFQNRSYEALAFDRDYTSYFPMAVSRLNGADSELVLIKEIEKGDRLQIRNDEIIPVDSVLLSEEAMIDYSFVTGESKAVRKQSGDQIFAGGRQTSGIAVVEAIKPVKDGYLTSLWQQKVFDKEKIGDYARLTDRLSRVFLWAVLGVATIGGIAWTLIDPHQAPEIVTAILIVSCPCALALALPFTFGHTQRFLGKAGLYLKDSLIIENLTEVTDIVFDKTGTITSGSDFAVEWHGSDLSQDEVVAIHSIVGQSTHPFSKAIFDYLTPADSIKTTSFAELRGKGIIAEIGGAAYKIGSANLIGEEAESGSRVYISRNDEVLGYFSFGNDYRMGIFSEIEALKSDFNCHVLSGDNEGEKEFLSSVFDPQNLHFGQQPHDKLEYIERLQNEGRTVLMVGDGLNDAGALKQSDVGLAVAEDVHHFSPACDGIIRADRLSRLSQYLTFSTQSRKVLRIALVFSLIYNLVGLSFAIAGTLTPLVAAILMPLSSITIIALSTLLVGMRARKMS